MDERIEFVAVPDGGRLWVATSGKGQPMLLCHGGPGLWDYLAPVAGMIDGLVTVHRYDQRGCGRSTHEGPYSIVGYVEDMEALRRQFGYERWVVAGHSWGASLAPEYAWAHPERVRAIIYVSGTGLGRDWKPAHNDAFDAALTAEERQRLGYLDARKARSEEEERESLILRWSTDYVDHEAGLREASRFYDEGFTVNYECNRQINDQTKLWVEQGLIERCASLSMPVLIVHGEQDPRPSSATDSLFEALPDAERRIIEGAGHLPWVETQAEFEQTLRAFLEKRALA
jgi:proline iminopeptidase